MSSKRQKRPIVKEKLKSLLDDNVTSKTEKPTRLYMKPQPTIIAMRQVPESIPDHITAVADYPRTIGAQKGSQEAGQAPYIHHHTTASRKNCALHLLQHSLTRSLQEDTPVGMTLCHELLTCHLDQ